MDNEDAGRAGQAVFLQQRALLGRVVGEVDFKYALGRHGGLHFGAAEGFVFHLLAAGAPVGIKIQHHRLAAGQSLLHGAVELLRRGEYPVRGLLRWEHGERLVQEGGLHAHALHGEKHAHGE